MKCIVTGAAGFIGSHLCERLLRAGHQVVGIDSFVPYYPRDVKERNLAKARSGAGFQFVEADLRFAPLDPLVEDAEAVFHLAAMAGLNRSWTDCDLYVGCNVQGTERLVQALHRAAPQLRRFILASTSSVYGKFASGDEGMVTRPISPYGVTKLACEHLCQAFMDTFSLPLVILRYFSVYGPRQRPDMAYHKFIRALILRAPLEICGDGHQVRGNTYVADCVDATVAALEAPIGEIYNVGGGETASVWEVVRHLEALAGRHACCVRVSARPGDQRSTAADTSKLRRHLHWQPRIGLQEGLAAQWQWQLEESESAPSQKVA